MTSRRSQRHQALSYWAKTGNKESEGRHLTHSHYSGLPQTKPRFAPLRSRSRDTFGRSAVNTQDEDLIRLLLPQWYAWRRWAEELLCRSFALAAPEEILKRPGKGGVHAIPGTTWHYRAHGVGVDIDRGLVSGGIDFDFDKQDPDPWRLKLFAEKQLNAGNLPWGDYRSLLDDEERFTSAAMLVLQLTRSDTPR